MCLLVMLSRTHAGAPLIVGGNRDERFDRPAVPMAVLHDGRPRVLGGRDELAGGTWLAVNEHGVIAGLTNRPMNGEPDRSKRSRGELPLALAGHTSAAKAVDGFVATFHPADFNPAWLLVADRDSAFGLDMTGTDEPIIHVLGPGVHILENRPVTTPSPKTEHVRRVLGDVASMPVADAVARVQAVLADHEPPTALDGDDEPEGSRIPLEYKTACVHYTDEYGTRWSSVITVPHSRDDRPAVKYADGPPCTTPYVDAGPLWRGESGS